MAILEERINEDMVLVAYDRRSAGASARREALRIDDKTGRVDMAQSPVHTVSVSIGAEVANAIDVACRIVNGIGEPVLGVKPVLIRALAVTDGNGDLAAATAAVGTVRKTTAPTAGFNEQWMDTSSAGAFSFKVSNPAAEATLVEIVLPNGKVAMFTLTFV
jgi:hypothetical protein